MSAGGHICQVLRVIRLLYGTVKRHPQLHPGERIRYGTR